MKVILLHDVASLGKKFDVKNVSDGHAINMLIPRGLAKEATESAVKQLTAQKEKLESALKIQDDLAQKSLSALDGKKITITVAANDKGHLFAALHASDVVAALKSECNVDVAERYVSLSHAIKEVGEHSVTIAVKDASAKIIVDVKAK